MSMSRPATPSSPVPSRSLPLDSSPLPSSSTPLHSDLPPVHESSNSIRNRLIKSGCYLGMGVLSSDLVWHQLGREEVIVDPSTLNNVSPTVLELSFVAKVSPRDFYMDADGAYAENSNKLFENTRALCYMVKPQTEPWASDWEGVIGFFRSMEDSRNKNDPPSRGLFREPERNSVRVVHELYSEKCSENDGKDDGKEDGDSGDDENANHPPIPKHPTHPDLLIQNWPVSRAKTRTQLALIKDTHVVNPIPVIDRKGDLVMPKFYRQRLSGAEVRCHVSIQHWEITREKTDTYNVRLQKMQILHPPPPAPMTPTKRRLERITSPLDAAILFKKPSN